MGISVTREVGGGVLGANPQNTPTPDHGIS
jgi:hypothetical protein